MAAGTLARRQLSYVLPVHNEEAVLAANVARLLARLSAEEGAEILLVENGSKDASWELCRSIARDAPSGGVRILAHQSAQGIGYAYDTGLREALARHGASRDRFAILTASDLPFGFTDLEGFERAIAQDPAIRIAMGSKAHGDSVGGRTPKRAVMSFAYRALRRVTLGMRVGDSQGSVFARLDLASAILPKIESRGFFYSTELCFFAELGGDRIVEMPVALEEEKRKSTVRPWQDGSRMFLQLIELQRRTKSRVR